MNYVSLSISMKLFRNSEDVWLPLDKWTLGLNVVDGLSKFCLLVFPALSIDSRHTAAGTTFQGEDIDLGDEYQRD